MASLIQQVFSKSPKAHSAFCNSAVWNRESSKWNGDFWSKILFLVDNNKGTLKTSTKTTMKTTKKTTRKTTKKTNTKKTIRIFLIGFFIYTLWEVCRI